MQQGLTPKEAVRLAKESLGAATAQELAAYIQESFGLTIKPPIVTVLLGTFQERASLERSGQAAYEKLEQWKAENPEEARKMAETVKRREAAARRKAEATAAKAKEAIGAVLSDEPPSNPGIHFGEEAQVESAAGERNGSTSVDGVDPGVVIAGPGDGGGAA